MTAVRHVLAEVTKNGAFTVITPDVVRPLEEWLAEGWMVEGVYPLSDGSRMVMRLEQDETSKLEARKETR